MYVKHVHPVQLHDKYRRYTLIQYTIATRHIWCMLLHNNDEKLLLKQLHCPRRLENSEENQKKIFQQTSNNFVIMFPVAL